MRRGTPSAQRIQRRSSARRKLASATAPIALVAMLQPAPALAAEDLLSIADEALLTNAADTSSAATSDAMAKGDQQLITPEEAPTDHEENEVTQNAVAESSDAFGKQVGRESTGLYNSRSVRGFNPIDAGNVRLDSLYFDQIHRLSPRLNASSTIRVGLSTMGFSFPAPTGLVDYAIRRVGDDTSLTIDADTRPDGHESVNLELRLPDVTTGVGLFAGWGFRHRKRPDGGTDLQASWTTLAELESPGGVTFSGFYMRGYTRDDEAGPTYFLAGEALPPELKRQVDLSQEWADNHDDITLVGGILRAPLGDFQLESGLFYQYKTEDARFADLMNGVAPDGSVADRTIIAYGDLNETSWSGEVRLVRQFGIGSTQHQLSASLRGRDFSGLFGGATRIALGPSTILAPDPRAKPDYVLGDKNRDKVRQIFGGVAYSGILTDWLRVDAGASKIDYTKDVDYADPALTDISTASSPIAWNAALSIDLTSKLTLYGSVTRGMEEADVAPDRAINRAEAPAAINTKQEEVVLRYAPSDAITVLAGLFRISKPYYNLDPDLRYRLLGEVVNQGLELSAVARPIAGVTLLGGALISDPTISGEVVDNGVLGPRPVGQNGVRVIGNLDWRFADGESPLSIDAAFEYKGSRPVNATNTFYVGSETTFDLGMRYRFEFKGARMIFRSKIENVTDDYSWNVTPSGGLKYTRPRVITFQLITVI